MIYLIRNSLKPFITQVDKDSHAGLLMQRGLQVWQGKETTDQKDKSDKQDLIGSICKTMPSELYLLAFNRWLNTTYDKTAFATLSATIDGRLFAGLPLGGTLETGAMTHHSYGMPMIAGSSIKGAVRSYTEHLFAKRLIDGSIDYKIENQSGKKIKKLQFDNDKKEILEILFGTDSDDENADAGYLIWHDAWWIPQITGDGKLATGEHKNQPFASEIVTVHHQKYYNGDLSEALDIENPVPNQQIGIQGSFYFVIEGESKWAEYALKLLQKTLTQQGLGAKGSNGYGYFQLNKEKTIQPFLEYQKKQQELKEKFLEEKRKEAELAEASKNATALEVELLTEISEKNWRISNQDNQQSFTQRLDYWLSILESNPHEKGCVDLMITVAKIQYERQMKKPDKAKPNQQVWIKRLLALK